MNEESMKRAQALLGKYVMLGGKEPGKILTVDEKPWCDGSAYLHGEYVGKGYRSLNVFHADESFLSEQRPANLFECVQALIKALPNPDRFKIVPVELASDFAKARGLKHVITLDGREMGAFNAATTRSDIDGMLNDLREMAKLPELPPDEHLHYSEVLKLRRRVIDLEEEINKRSIASESSERKLVGEIHNLKEVIKVQSEQLKCRDKELSTMHNEVTRLRQSRDSLDWNARVAQAAIGAMSANKAADRSIAALEEALKSKP